MKYEQLQSGQAIVLHELMEVFADAFEDNENYRSAKPRVEYVEKLLTNSFTIVLVAKNEEGKVVGGLIAYELPKFEQERSEVYLYDLAVAAAYRRQGIATELITMLKKIARERGAAVIFVQADNVDAPAVALYTKLASSVESAVTHFDIPANDA